MRSMDAWVNDSWVLHKLHLWLQVTAHDPESGEKLHTVALPVTRVSACIFGGPDLTQLFITTIQVLSSSPQ